MPRTPRRLARTCLPSVERLEERSLLSVNAGEMEELFAPPRLDATLVGESQVLSAAWVPNDSRFAEQWDLKNTGQRAGTPGADIGAEIAWNTTTGSSRVIVAVLDSGIDYTHQDLYLNIWVNQKEIPASRRAQLIDVNRDGLITFRDLNDARNQGAGKITDLNANGRIDGGDLLQRMIKDAQGRDTGRGGWADGQSQDGDRYIDDLIGWNANTNTNNPKDDFGHGTHVAGTVGAVGHNGVGVAGIAWGAQLMPVRFFNGSGQATPEQYAAALEYSLAKGAKISVNSFTSGHSATIEAAVKKAHQAGQVYIAAAGNGGRNSDTSPSYPASYGYDNVVSVAATDRKDALAPWSNFGPQSVDIAAPGVDVLSTNIASYGTRSGTSMAAPHVAGVAALVWGLRPEWNYRQVINHVLGTGKDLTGLRGKVAHGRLDAAAAVRVPPRDGPQPSSASVSGNTVVAGRPGGLGPAEILPEEALIVTPSADTGAVVRARQAARLALPVDVFLAPRREDEAPRRSAPRPVEQQPVDWLFSAGLFAPQLGEREDEEDWSRFEKPTRPGGDPLETEEQP